MDGIVLLVTGVLRYSKNNFERYPVKSYYKEKTESAGLAQRVRHTWRTAIVVVAAKIRHGLIGGNL